LTESRFRSPRRLFLLGFDRDSQPSGEARTALATATCRADLQVAPRQWRIERSTSPRPGGATADYLKTA
jgi:hypothetical protein